MPEQPENQWIYRIDTDSFEFKKLSDQTVDNIGSVNILGDQLIFCKQHKLFSMSLDGTNMKQLTATDVKQVTRHDENIYYLNEQNQLCKLNLDGQKVLTNQQLQEHDSYTILQYGDILITLSNGEKELITKE